MRIFITSDRMSVRLTRLFVGLFGYGFAIALMIRGNIGASPWDVFGQGVARSFGISFGVSTVAISAVVLLFWIPLRQKPGAGTLFNAVLVGVFADLGLLLLPQPGDLILRVGSFGAGLLLLAAATALYIGAGLGPGPRDGLMTGLVRTTGLKVWMVRTAIEAAVVLAGWALGGVVGVGTVVFAVAIGPLTQLALRLLSVRLDAPAGQGREQVSAGA